MAVIKVDDRNAWAVPRWVQRYVLERINLAEMSAALAKQIPECIEHQTYYLDLTHASLQDRKVFCMQTTRILESLKQGGPNSLSSPEFYDGLLESVIELQQILFKHFSHSPRQSTE